MDNDSKISRDELSNVLFGSSNSNTAWNGKLQSIFDDDYKNIMLSLSQIILTPQMVNNVADNLTLSPIQITNMKRLRNDTKRDANREYICFKNVFCYFAYFGEDAKDKKHIFDPSNEIDSTLFVDGIFIDSIELDEEENQRVNEAVKKCKNK